MIFNFTTVVKSPTVKWVPIFCYLLIASLMIPLSAYAGWTPPELAENYNNSSCLSSFVLSNKDGNALVLWTQFESRKQVLYARWYSKQSGWQEIKKISSSDDKALMVTGVLSSNDIATIVWINDTDDDVPQLVTCRYDIKNDNVSQIQQLESPDIFRGVMYPVVAINNQDFVQITWQLDQGANHGDGYRRIYASRYNPNKKEWSSTTKIGDWESSTVTAEGADVAINNKGDALITWKVKAKAIVDGSLLYFKIPYAQRYRNGVWDSKYTRLNKDNSSCRIPIPVITDSFEAVFWMQEKSIVICRATANGWNEPSPIYTAQKRIETFDVRPGTNGTIHTLWSDEDGKVYTGSMTTSGATISNVKTLEAANGSVKNLTLCTNTKGDVLAYWRKGASISITNPMTCIFNNQNQKWDDVKVLSANTTSQVHGAISESGDGALVWLSWETNVNNVRFSRYSSSISIKHPYPGHISQSVTNRNRCILNLYQKQYTSDDIYSLDGRKIPYYGNSQSFPPTLLLRFNP